MAIARLLTGEYHVEPLASNITAIMVCSMVNFAASEWLVFRRTASLTAVMLLIGSAAFASPGPESVELRAPTLQAWSAYERQVDARLKNAAAEGSPFFALDAFGLKGWKRRRCPAGSRCSAWNARSRVVVRWTCRTAKFIIGAGAVFVPGVTLQAVLQHLAKQAGRESDYYDDVIASRLLARDGATHRVFLKLRRTKVVTVTYNTEHAVEVRQLGASRATARSVSTRIADSPMPARPTSVKSRTGAIRGFSGVSTPTGATKPSTAACSSNASRST